MSKIAIDIGYGQTKIKYKDKIVKFPTSIALYSDTGIEYGDTNVYEFIKTNIVLTDDQKNAIENDSTLKAAYLDPKNITDLDNTLVPFIIFYAIYNLMGLKLPELKNQNWAFAAGLFGGIMSGAFNTSGPPIVAYAHSQKWEVKEFKANLQAYFLMTTIMANFSHLIAGNFQMSMLPKILFALPFVLLGNSLGIYVSQFIKPEIFRKVVLLLLLVIGIKMLF